MQIVAIVPTISTGPPAFFILSLFMKNPTDASKGSSMNLPINASVFDISSGTNQVAIIAVNTKPGTK